MSESRREIVHAQHLPSVERLGDGPSANGGNRHARGGKRVAIG